MTTEKTLKDKEQSDLTELKWFWSEDVKKFIIDLKEALKHEDYIFEDDFASLNKLIDELAGNF
jgi:hypothetical protein